MDHTTRLEKQKYIQKGVSLDRCLIFIRDARSFAIEEYVKIDWLIQKINLLKRFPVMHGHLLFLKM